MNPKFQVNPEELKVFSLLLFSLGNILSFTRDTIGQHKKI